MAAFFKKSLSDFDEERELIVLAFGPFNCFC